MHLRPFVSTNVNSPRGVPFPSPDSKHDTVPADRSRLWLISVVGFAAYMVGVMRRTSFGIARLDAAARFDASPAVLYRFVVLRLLVYAGLQVPAG